MQTPYRGLFALLVGILVLLIAVSACSRPTEQQPLVSPRAVADQQAARRIGREELLAELSAKDFGRAVEVLNAVKSMSYQGEVIPVLDRLWRGDLGDASSLDPAFIAHPRIRLEFADVLAQASSNGWKGLASAEYASYARAHVTHNDPEVARQAILVLGVVRDARDVALLSKTVRDGSPATAPAAVSSLMRICSFTEDQAQALGRDLKSDAQRATYAQMWLDIQTLRQHSCR